MHAWGICHPALKTLKKSVITLAPIRTNPYSATYLTAAAEGGRFGLVEECLNTLGTNEYERAFNRLINIGASSGVDMLAGILFAARLLNDKFTQLG